jgi:hypothetical protein
MKDDKNKTNWSARIWCRDLATSIFDQAGTNRFEGKYALLAIASAGFAIAAAIWELREFLVSTHDSHG